MKMMCPQSEMWGLQHSQAAEANLVSYEVCYCVSGGGPDGKAKAQDYSTVHIRGTRKKEGFFYHAIVLGASSHSHGGSSLSVCGCDGSRLSVCGGYEAWCTGGSRLSVCGGYEAWCTGGSRLSVCGGYEAWGTGGSRLSVCGGYEAWGTGGCWCWELCCSGWFGCGDVGTLSAVVKALSYSGVKRVRFTKEIKWKQQANQTQELSTQCQTSLEQA